MRAEPEIEITIAPGAIAPRTPTSEYRYASVSLPIGKYARAKLMAREYKTSFSRLANIGLDALWDDFVRKYPDKAQAFISAGR